MNDAAEVYVMVECPVTQAAGE